LKLSQKQPELFIRNQSPLARFYPLFFCFFLLASGLSAQTPDDTAGRADSVAPGRHISDTLPRPAKAKRKPPAPGADSGQVQKAATAGAVGPVQDTGIHRPAGIRKNHPDSIAHSGADKELHQPGDSGAILLTDSFRYSNSKPVLKNMPFEWMELLAANPFLNFTGEPVRVREQHYQARSYDALFYLLVGLLFYFAVIKLAFGKYLGNLLTLFFRVSMRQQQIREQVIQSPVPSVLLNLLFVLSAGLYASFLMQFYHFARQDQFWSYFLYSALALTAIYLVKFLFLKVTGWTFGIKKAVDTYLFIVFMTNKIIGVFLLPFLIILSFSGTLISVIGITGSVVMIGIFYSYRIFASFKSLRKEINISGLHFFLYLCAFEIAPLLLIYKVLLTYLGKAH
jgi:hypothetical protein